MVFRAYDKAWNRTGYSEQPQYSGQADLTHDFKPNCGKCGGDIVRVTVGYAHCSKGHSWQKELIGGN